IPERAPAEYKTGGCGRRWPMKRLLLFCALLGIAAAADTIVKHPRELRFPKREYAPPAAADFRHKLANGATAFLVEDHEFPLVTVTVLIHTGDYLDPKDKTVLAQLMGGQMRSEGTQAKPRAVVDEETAILAAQLRSAVPHVS